MDRRRKAIDIAQRRQAVAGRYLHGATQWEIANALEVTQSCVSKDLKAIQAEWLASSVRDFDAIKAEQLAKVDSIEREHWAAWERSKRPDAEGNQRDGDPRFLDGVLKCVTKRCEMLGVLQREFGAAPVVTVLSGVDLAAVCGDAPPKQIEYDNAIDPGPDED